MRDAALADTDPSNLSSFVTQCNSHSLAFPLPAPGAFPRRCVMWSLIVCYVMGHDYSVSCDSSAMFLKCIACGHRSHGWTVREHGAHVHGTRA